MCLQTREGREGRQEGAWKDGERRYKDEGAEVSRREKRRERLKTERETDVDVQGVGIEREKKTRMEGVETEWREWRDRVDGREGETEAGPLSTRWSAVRNHATCTSRNEQ